MSTEVKRGRPRKVAVAVEKPAAKPATKLDFTANEFNVYVAAVVSFLGSKDYVVYTHVHSDQYYSGDSPISSANITIERRCKSRLLNNLKALKNSLVKIGLLPNSAGEYLFSEEFAVEYINHAKLLGSGILSADDLSKVSTYRGPVPFTNKIMADGSELKGHQFSFTFAPKITK